MSSTEDRLRSAFADAARTVRPETLRPLTVAAPERPRSTRWIVPLVAAVSAGVLVAGVATLRDQGTGRPRQPDPVHPSAPSVPPGDLSAATSTPMRAAMRGVVKVTPAPTCGRKPEGTGFVYAPERVMTTAHTVAGSRGPVEVSTPSDRRPHQATVVLYNPRRDVAVLAVPGLRAPALTFGPAGASRTAAVIVGYPSGSSTSVMIPARIRARQTVTGLDIYRSPTLVRREIFSVRANVPDGRAGAPLLATDGTVYGMVFAAALDADETAYALTAKEIAPDAQAGRTTDQAVPTQVCSS